MQTERNGTRRSQRALIDTAPQPERALLLCLDTGDYDGESSLQELSELVRTAGAVPAAELLQRRPRPEAATCLGSGMVEEAARVLRELDLDLAVFDRELTPVQIRNLEEAFGVRVVDRTMLILDIFAQRARSREGKLQVELAQLRYLLPRLTGRGTALSRLGGGIGTRGPGETQLETDRRHIRRRIASLKEQLAESEAVRAVTQRRRAKDGVLTVALVGYTNAGKSTLMNRLTDAGVLAEDKLFATLDPTARALKLPSGRTVLLVDTVGLLRRLPHHLVEAFHSTLEQAASADVLLNICDASSPEAAEHLQVTEDLLRSLGAGEAAVIPVLNKWDAVTDPENTLRIPGAVRLSARTGFGVEDLLAAVDQNLPHPTRDVDLLLPFAKGGLLASLREQGAVLREEYVAEGIAVTARVDDRLYAQVKAYLLP